MADEENLLMVTVNKTVEVEMRPLEAHVYFDQNHGPDKEGNLKEEILVRYGEYHDITRKESLVQ